jgi:hypothetical protein
MSTTSPEPTVRSGRSTLAGVVGNKSPTTLITTAILTGALNSSDCSLRVAPEERVSQRVKRSGVRMRHHRAYSGLLFVEGTLAWSVPAPATTAGCSLAALSSPSTTLMARSSSTSACRAAAAPTPTARGACIPCAPSVSAAVPPSATVTPTSTSAHRRVAHERARYREHPFLSTPFRGWRC